MAEPGKPDCILHLVHGTFARDADWIHPESALAREVKAGLGNEVLAVPFVWSGANSHRARRQAGQELAQGILASCARYPGVPHYVVAHSHGGNVAAYALNEEGVRPLVAGVACLGTPFIKARVRDLQGSRRLWQWVLGAAITVVLLLVLSVAYTGTRLVLDPTSALYSNSTYPPLPDQVLESDPVALVLLLFYAFIAFGFGWVLTRPVVWLWRFVLDRELPRLGAAQPGLIARLTAKFADTPLLVVDATGDEAAWWLRLVSRIAAVPYRIWKPSTFTLVGMAVLTALVLVPLLTHWEPSTDGMGVPFLVLISGLVLFSISTLGVALLGWLICLIWPAIFRSHALGFGRDDFLQNFAVEITSVEIPEASAQVTRKSLAVVGHGLHHSRLYKDETVLKLLRGWFRTLRSTAAPT